MRSFLTWMRAAFARRTTNVMRVACVQPLAAGVTIYAIDIDGRRLVIGACARSVCVLDRYPSPATALVAQREPAPPAPK